MAELWADTTWQQMVVAGISGWATYYVVYNRRKGDKRRNKKP